MRKKFTLVVSMVLLLIVISGCSNLSNVSKQDTTLAVSMKIPESVSTQAFSGSITSGVLKMIKGTTTQEVPLIISGTTATATVASPEEGTWQLIAELRDSENYIVYRGEENAVVQSGGQTQVTMTLEMTPGNATATVNLTNLPNVASGIIKFSNGSDLMFEQVLDIAAPQGTAGFTNMLSRIWDIQVDLFDINGSLVTSAQSSIEILSGRTNYVMIDFASTGDMTVEVLWELPPTPPTNVTSSIVNNYVQLSWTPSTESDVVGYRIYKSFDEAGPYIRVGDPLIVGTSYLDLDTYPGHTYWYQVLSVDDEGIDSGFDTPVATIYDFGDTTGELGLANTPAPTAGINQQRTGQSQYVGPQLANLSWTTPLNGTSMSNPVIGQNGTLYTSDFATYELKAFEADGTPKWTFKANSNIRSTPTIAADGTIYFSAQNDKFYALNPDGTEKWSLNISSPSYSASSPNIADDGTIYVGGNYHLYAINPDGTQKWRFPTNTESNNVDPAIGPDGTIYFAASNTMYALNPDASVKWSYTMSGTVGYTAPVVAQDNVIYITTSTKYYAFNPSGTVKWSIAKPSLTTPAVKSNGNTVLVSGSDIHEIDTEGNIVWTKSLGYALHNDPIIGADGTIYVISYTDNVNGKAKIWAFYDNGDVKWTYLSASISTSQSTPALAADGTLYVTTSTDLYAFHD